MDITWVNLDIIFIPQVVIKRILWYEPCASIKGKFDEDEWNKYDIQIHECYIHFIPHFTLSESQNNITGHFSCPTPTPCLVESQCFHSWPWPQYSIPPLHSTTSDDVTSDFFSFVFLSKRLSYQLVNLCVKLTIWWRHVSAINNSLVLPSLHTIKWRGLKRAMLPSCIIL